MKRLLISIIVIVSTLTGYSQSYDEHISNAINTGDWFALDSIYSSAPKDSITPFLEVYSRGLIGNRLNRPDISIPAFEKLLRSYSANLDLSNLLNSAVMLSMDLSRVGENSRAASLLSSVLDATRQYLDSAAIGAVRRYIDQYTAFNSYKPYAISFTSDRGRIPFRLVPVGNPKREAILMQLDDCRINGADADIIFDTGAGVNIISDSLARKYNLIPLEAYNEIMGIGRQKACYAIAEKLTLGNIIVRDVPFLIVNLTLDNEEANRYIDSYSIVVGGELMLQLKDLTLDFAKREITVPSVACARSSTRPNMFFSSQMNLLTKGEILNDTMLVCIDTGDASFGSLNGHFFNRNQEYILANAHSDTIRTAGIGGVKVLEGYRLPDVAVSIGGATAVLPSIFVNEGLNPFASDYECNLGLKSLIKFGKIRFNMVDFTITASPSPIPSSLLPEYKIPTFKYTHPTPSLLQSVGVVAFSIADGLFNANAPSVPD